VTLGDVLLELQGSVLVARLTGEVDLSNARGIEEAIAVATPNNAAAVIVDLSGLDYLDSAGIQLLYQLREHLQARGQELTLVLPADSAAADALRLAGVIDQLGVADTLEQALASSAEGGVGPDGSNILRK
jgi:anti-anti-sigma factor